MRVDWERGRTRKTRACAMGLPRVVAGAEGGGRWLVGLPPAPPRPRTSRNAAPRADGAIALDTPTPTPTPPRFLVHTASLFLVEPRSRDRSLLSGCRVPSTLPPSHGVFPAREGEGGRGEGVRLQGSSVPAAASLELLPSPCFTGTLPRRSASPSCAESWRGSSAPSGGTRR